MMTVSQSVWNAAADFSVQMRCLEADWQTWRDAEPERKEGGRRRNVVFGIFEKHSVSCVFGRIALYEYKVADRGQADGQT
mmetsp:Transcript_141775/g.245229  ORF Transcript_141775/g.245229 Transcript_141775/m.245229 type:complete len:80 (+) Transcript_141775:1002-1241(+)